MLVYKAYAVLLLKVKGLKTIRPWSDIVSTTTPHAVKVKGVKVRIHALTFLVYKARAVLLLKVKGLTMIRLRSDIVSATSADSGLSSERYSARIEIPQGCGRGGASA